MEWHLLLVWGEAAQPLGRVVNSAAVDTGVHVYF